MIAYMMLISLMLKIAEESIEEIKKS